MLIFNKLCAYIALFLIHFKTASKSNMKNSLMIIADKIIAQIKKGHQSTGTDSLFLINYTLLYSISSFQIETVRTTFYII